jgi:hypothetical protein
MRTGGWTPRVVTMALAGVLTGGNPSGAQSGAPSDPAMTTAQAVTVSNSPQLLARLRAAESRARSEPEWALVAVSYRAIGDMANTRRVMCEYLRRFPSGPRADGFRAYLGGHRC